VTIVQLSDLDDFLKDSLSIVRRGVANARNANQSNPALGIMADLPDKVDYEIMVVSNHQFLNRITSTSSTDTSLINEASGSGELGSGITSSSSVESGVKTDSRNENSLESSTSTNTRTSSSGQSSTEGAGESSQGTSQDTEQSGSTGGGSGGGGDNETRTENGTETGTRNDNSTDNETKNGTRNSNNNSNETKNENSRSRQSGQTAEQNLHQVKGFDQKTGRWGGQSFAPVAPVAQSLKCS
jgi:hypothetical protein